MMPKSDAEQLLDIANMTLHPRERLIISEGDHPCACDTVALALKLRSRPDVAFRALIGQWSRFQIVRELY